jgi:rhodanese-related sulfurtransferase
MKLQIKWFAVVLPILVALFLTACASKAQPPGGQTQSGQAAQQPGGSYSDISVEELQKLLANKDFTFVNVHIPFEGDIPDTDLSIPFDEIEQNLDLLPADKSARIVLYCRSGRMSTIAAEKLAELGYSNVQNLEGGMLAWEQADLPLLGK